MRKPKGWKFKGNLGYRATSKREGRAGREEGREGGRKEGIKEGMMDKAAGIFIAEGLEERTFATLSSQMIVLAVEKSSKDVDSGTNLPPRMEIAIG